MPEQILKRYRVLKRIGAGGMGEVYLAHDENLHRNVAVKILPAGALDSESSRKRFRKEAEVLSRLNHPHIAVVHDFDTQDGTDFLVMEHISGETLKEKLARGPLPVGEALRLCAQMAQALEEAHEQGIVHRDLKPSNIMVTPKGQAKVLDFGLAVAVRAETMVTRSASEAVGPAAAGTLPYMAPEQFLDEEADPRTDLYALGAVLYEAVTGQRPFPQQAAASLMEAILHRAPEAPCRLNPKVPAELERIILKCLEKDRERRYQSSRELRVDLQRLLQPTPVMAAEARGTPWRRFARYARSHPWTFGVPAGLVALAVIVGLWLMGTRPALSFGPRDWVLVADFENGVEDPQLDRALLTASSVSLSQSTHANVYPRARLPEVLRRMGKTNVERLDEGLAREICLRENVRGLVTATVSRVGEQYLLSVHLVDPQSGERVRSYLERAGNSENMLEKLGHIAARLREDLGESLSAIRQRSLPLQQVTTPSLEALKLYTQGEEMWRKGNYQEAIQLYHDALAKDSDFAMAHSALGNAYFSHVANQPQRGSEHYEKALALTDRVTERERMYIQVSYKASLGHVDEAIVLYRNILNIYPDDLVMRYNLGSLLMRYGRDREAVEQLREVVRIWPSYASAHINLATAHSGMGETAEALRHYQKAFELEPEWVTNSNLNHEYGFALVRAEKLDEARQVFEQALEKQDLRPRGLRSLALLDMHQGRYGEAARKLNESIILNQAARWLLSSARDRVFLSLVREGRGDTAGQLRELTLAERDLEVYGSPNVWMQAHMARGYARAGKLQQVVRLLEKIRQSADQKNPGQRSDALLIEGEAALLRGQHARGLELFLLADGVLSGPLTREAVARAYVQTGQREQAIEWYEMALAAGHQFLGWEAQPRLPEAHLRLAELHLASGNAAKAREMLQAFHRLWEGAERELVLVQQAARLEAQLARESRSVAPAAR